MIQEAYVSFEIAKLLKEKGFNEPIRCWYDNFQDFHEEGMRMSNTDCLPPTVMCPTCQMAMAWLREKYNINIDIVSIWEQKRWEYQVYIITPSTSKHPYRIDILYTAYEEAVEAALKYCLEKLI